MQIYRSFDVGTATPDPSELERFSHHGINEKSPAEEYNVNEFLEIADHGIKQAASQGRVPIILGGTGLYLKNFLYGMDDMPPANEKFRRRLRREAEETSRQAIHDRLREVDPQAAEQIHPNDLKRTIRALEIYHETGRTKTELIEQQGEETIRPEVAPRVIGLRRPMDALRTRIRQRVNRMIEQGLIEEVNRLREEWEVSETVKQAIGYSEVVDYLNDELNREQLVDTMTDNTYQFARKQMTWFRQLPVDTWYHPEENREELIEDIESIRERTA